MLSNNNIPEEFIEASINDEGAERLLLYCKCNLDTAINLGVSSLLFDTIKYRVEYFINQGIKSFVLGNTDTWPNLLDTENYAEVIDYLNNKKDIFFIIQTIGYDTKRHSDNVVEIGLPICDNNLVIQSIQNKGKRNHSFSCLNHYPKYFRIHLGYELWKNNLLDGIIFSQSIIDQMYLGKTHIKLSHLEHYNKYIDILPIKNKYEPDGGRYEFKNLDFDVFDVTHTAFNDTYAHIYTESEIDRQVCTEKTIKPYQAGQVAIPLTPVGHLPYLRELGFHTFDDLLGDNYDSLDYNDKISVIVSIVSKGKQFIEDYHTNNYTKIVENNINLQNMFNKGLTRLRKVL
tara:strand:- start:714 stop:1745 length:1032 start_codon:yes stop_codon:yes gene_type:complete